MLTDVYSVPGVFALPTADSRGLLSWSGRLEPEDDADAIRRNFHVFTMDHFYPTPANYWQDVPEALVDWRLTLSPGICSLRHPRPVYNRGMYAARLVHPAIRPLDPQPACRWDLLIPHRMDPVKNWQMFVAQAHELRGLRVLVLTQPGWSHAFDRQAADVLEACALAHGFEYRCEWLDTSAMNRLYNASRAIAMFSETEGDSRVLHEAFITGCQPCVWSGTRSLLQHTGLGPYITRFASFGELRDAIHGLPAERPAPTADFMELHNFWASNGQLRAIAGELCNQQFEWLARDAVRAFYHRQMDTGFKLGKLFVR